MAKRYVYPPELDRWVRENVKGHTLEELWQRFQKSDVYDLCPGMTKNKLDCYKKNRRLKSGVKPRKTLPVKYPIGGAEYCRSIADGRPRPEIYEMFLEHFNLQREDFKYEAFIGWLKRNKIRNGMMADCQFRKGIAAHMKGQWHPTEEMRKKMERTWFKKGQTPPNKKPVGTISARNSRKDGPMLWIKVGDGPHDWKQLSRYVWEQYHGPIPKGKKIILLDRNGMNCDISNLAMVSDRVHVVMNNKGLRSDIPEVTQVGINLAKVKLKLIDCKASRKKQKRDIPSKIQPKDS